MVCESSSNCKFGLGLGKKKSEFKDERFGDRENV